MEKRIEYEIFDIIDGYLQIVITHQTHIDVSFGEKNEEFRDSKGTVLYSATRPEYIRKQLICVRGTNPRYDKQTIQMTSEAYPYFKNAIEEYNEYFREKKENNVATSGI